MFRQRLVFSSGGFDNNLKQKLSQGHFLFDEFYL